MSNIQDYDITEDKIIQRPAGMPTRNIEEWTMEHPLYDVRFDCYWLVTRYKYGYSFAGPVNLSADILDTLPEMSITDRNDAMLHVPDQPNHGIVIPFLKVAA